MTPKIAVIGSGAAALGVLHAVFKRYPDVEVTMFDIGKSMPPTSEHLSDASPSEVQDFYSAIYSQLKSEYGLRFPPLKSHFGNSLDRYTIGDSKRFFVSDRFGGLTQFWGATLLPFLPSDMAGWPFNHSELHPYYKEMAEFVGISGRSDSLDRIFSRQYITRPPIQVSKGLQSLDQVINQSRPSGEYNVISGYNRVGVETRSNHKSACVYCGECMAGCHRGSVYSTQDVISHWIASKKINLVKQRVWRIVQTHNVDTSSIETKNLENSIQDIYSGFNQIFLCAGAVGSAEIMMRSLGLRSGPILYDNAIFQLPILNFGGASNPKERDQYLSLSNLILAFLPKDGSHTNAQAQIYPNFDYLWRNAIPESLWPIAKHPVSWLRDRLLWTRIYLHSQYCYKYALELDSQDQIQFRQLQEPDFQAIKPVVESLRNSLRNSPFSIPRMRPVISKTSSHLAGSFPFNGSLLNIGRSGETMSKVFLCDSSLFPASPATSLTFTIMANANRIATEALE